MTTHAWGVGIEPGAPVTTHGRHGVGQPAITGTVVRVDHGQTVVIRTLDGKTRQRTISNVRRIDPR